MNFSNLIGSSPAAAILPAVGCHRRAPLRIGDAPVPEPTRKRFRELRAADGSLGKARLPPSRERRLRLKLCPLAPGFACTSCRSRCDSSEEGKRFCCRLCRARLLGGTCRLAGTSLGMRMMRLQSFSEKVGALVDSLGAVLQSAYPPKPTRMPSGLVNNSRAVGHELGDPLGLTRVPLKEIYSHVSC